MSFPDVCILDVPWICLCYVLLHWLDTLSLCSCVYVVTALLELGLNKSSHETTYHCNPNTLMKTTNLRSINAPQPKVNNLHKKASINRI